MSVCWNQSPHPFNAEYNGMHLAVDSEGKYFSVYFKQLPFINNPWCQLPYSSPVYELCKIWRFTFEQSMSLQEFLDGQT